MVDRVLCRPSDGNACTLREGRVMISCNAMGKTQCGSCTRTHGDNQSYTVDEDVARLGLGWYQALLMLVVRFCAL